MEMNEVKELWGVQFSVVPEGLAENEVVSYVDDLREEVRKEREERERQASLLKLAEQTVIEADKLAESIKDQARKDAQEEAAGIIAASDGTAQEQANKIKSEAERDAEAQTSATIAKALSGAEEIIAKARKEAQEVIESVREKAASMEAEAKLEAEIIVRRFTVRFVEEIRSVVTETSNNILPNLDDLMRESGHSGVLGEGTDAQPTTNASEDS